MCALCGLLGASHWTEISAHPEAFSLEVTEPVRRERERRASVATAALAPFRIKVSDWEGKSYRVVSPTGRQEIADDIQAVWTAVETMLGRPFDPLDDTYINTLNKMAR
ncbi:MAG: hypothetical protein OXI87_24765 [Albidovulum sp.]|nr:hypothetical protein [Albidovulum sp.]MDE0533855.1 hypothetical protein [Albidovulum sp.]